MMQINVSQLLKAPVGAERQYSIEGQVNINEKSDPSDILGGVVLTRTSRSILVKAHVHTMVGLTCSRCLRNFGQSIDFDMEEEFFPTIDLATGQALALPEDEPEGFTIDKSHILDLSEAIRQYAIIAVPMKPLCKAECIGISYQPYP